MKAYVGFPVPNWLRTNHTRTGHVAMMATGIRYGRRTSLRSFTGPCWQLWQLSANLGSSRIAGGASEFMANYFWSRGACAFNLWRGWISAVAVQLSGMRSTLPKLRLEPIEPG